MRYWQAKTAWLRLHFEGDSVCARAAFSDRPEELTAKEGQRLSTAALLSSRSFAATVALRSAIIFCCSFLVSLLFFSGGFVMTVRGAR
ncbi:MAG: hypothetical protein WCI64_11005 [Chlorobium sp.]